MEGVAVVMVAERAAGAAARANPEAAVGLAVIVGMVVMAELAVGALRHSEEVRRALLAVALPVADRLVHLFGEATDSAVVVAVA